MAPPIESASMSGVMALVTSILSIRSAGNLSISTARSKGPRFDALAIRVPSIVTEFRLGSIPRTMTR